jgi:ribosomal protein S12 methylthiotransferase accessory factor YcaO
MADRAKSATKKDFKTVIQALVEYGQRLHLEVAAVAFSGLVKVSVMSVTVPALQQWAKENAWSLK